MKADEVYAQLTADLIREIEAGAGEWRMPWRKLGRLPKSLSTGKPYNGINVLVLGLTAELKGYTSNQWGTFNHWSDLGFSVQKGEKATWAILLKKVPPSAKKLKEDPEAKSFTLARAYPVFAREQTDAPPLPPEAELSEHERHEAAETFFAAIGADVRYGGDRAFYASVGDYIGMPALEQFPVRDHFYSTLAHEHTHWTGHESRLNRNLKNRFGDEAYAMEELCAEMGAAFIGAQLGLDPAIRKDHASYLKSWLSVLKQDPKALITVTSKAQAALDHLNKLAEPAELEEVA